MHIKLLHQVTRGHSSPVSHLQHWTVPYEEYKKVEQAYCEYFTSVLSQPLGICSTGTYSAGDTTPYNPQWVYLS